MTNVTLKKSGKNKQGKIVLLCQEVITSFPTQETAVTNVFFFKKNKVIKQGKSCTVQIFGICFLTP